MGLPVRFPTDADVIAEEATRFRALCPAARAGAVRGMVSARALLMARSPKADFPREHTPATEAQGRLRAGSSDRPAGRTQAGRAGVGSRQMSDRIRTPTWGPPSRRCRPDSDPDALFVRGYWVQAGWHPPADA
jgi:hypothetical protein